ncbi:hypothetical protein K9B35_14425 [Sphingomonas sp. R647]|uniref:hypothetical protein n=1 Tax=Sphingomonas sp. R647 TaxID=2875233 RepID=UPI001CD6CB50|nr:hypothetical protein [Sphingomonas sp. R647]MCA1199170.1 hypothetical protein [Sphingomonas sp. R647]
MKPNPGLLPPEAIGKRVRVPLVNGEEHDWPADGKGGASWACTGHPFDIASYEVL